jgi:hypothetical protein
MSMKPDPDENLRKSIGYLSLSPAAPAGSIPSVNQLPEEEYL